MSAAPQLASSDADPQETREWLEGMQAVIAQEGPERAHFLLEQLIAMGHQTGINMPYSANTEYINTIPADQQPVTPGDYEMEQKHPRLCALECDGHGAARQQGRLGPRRPHRQLRLGGHAV
jgi:pyruvate dehydrogenase complex dehydrogenase (E1) component